MEAAPTATPVGQAIISSGPEPDARVIARCNLYRGGGLNVLLCPPAPVTESGRAEVVAVVIGPLWLCTVPASLLFSEDDVQMTEGRDVVSLDFQAFEAEGTPVDNGRETR